MIWLQENYVIAVVGLVVAVFLLWWFFGRSKPQDIAPPIEPAKPAKPLEPVKPEIIAAEPARFKPIEPKPQPVTAATPPPAPEPVVKAAPSAPEPVAKAAPPAPEPAPPPKPAPVAAPVAKAAPPAPKPAAKPKAAVKPAAKKATATEPVAKPAIKPVTKAAAKPAVKKTPAAAAPAPKAPATPPPPAAKPIASPKTGADNLQLLKGIGPKLAVLLNGMGVTSFAQVAAWTDADVAAIDPQLGAFQGRIARDNIVDQAGYLARGDRPGFEAKYGALGSEI